MRIKSAILYWLVPAVLALLTYWSASHFNYVWDDWYLVGELAKQRDNRDWLGSLASPLPFSNNYFRPLVVATFLAENVFSLGAGFSHQINIGLHALNSLLVAVMVSSLWVGKLDEKRLQLYSVLAASFFAVHPCLTEGVAWVAGRFDLMAVTFFLLALIAEFKLRDGWQKAGILGALFFLALLCKEIAIALPLVVLTLRWAIASDFTAFKAAWLQGAWKVAAALIGAFVLYVCVRVGALGHFVTYEQQIENVPLGSTLQRILLVGLAFAEYLQMLYMPFVKSGVSRSASLPVALNDVQAWLGLLFLFVGVPLVVIGLSRSKQTGWRAIFALALAQFCLLLPVLQINPSPMLLGNTPTAERVVMMPATLVCAMLPWLLERLRLASGGMTAPSVLMGAAIAFSALLVSVALPAWSSERALWSYMSHTSPTWPLARINLAWELMYSDPRTSLAEARQALELVQQPWQRSTTLMMMAMAHERLHDLRAAEDAMRQAMAAETSDVGRSRYAAQLARMLAANKDIAGAEKALLESFKLSAETRVDAQLTMFEIAMARGDLAEAEIVVEQLRASLSPTSWRAIEKQLKTAQEKNRSR